MGNHSWIFSFLYPKGGWSLVMDKLVSSIHDKGVHVYLKEDISLIHRHLIHNEEQYEVISSNYIFKAPRLLLGLPPAFL